LLTAGGRASLDAAPDATGRALQASYRPRTAKLRPKRRGSQPTDANRLLGDAFRRRSFEMAQGGHDQGAGWKLVAFQCGPRWGVACSRGSRCRRSKIELAEKSYENHRYQLAGARSARRSGFRSQCCRVRCWRLSRWLRLSARRGGRAPSGWLWQRGGVPPGCPSSGGLRLPGWRSRLPLTTYGPVRLGR
jgi:hypothetical protein